MATQLFLGTYSPTTADTHKGTNTARRDGTAVGWHSCGLATTRGSSVADFIANTVTGATNGVEVVVGSVPAEWLSPPVSADVTISGTITANLWARETDMSANVAINIIVDIIRSSTSGADASNTIQNIVQSTRVTEVAVGAAGAEGVNNFTTGMTSGAYTGQTLNRGDRLRIRVVGDDVGTMASGYQFGIRCNGATAAVTGDSYVTFTENITFESAPGGTVVYLTDTASAVATASEDKEAWTSPGATAVSGGTVPTVNGWTAPLQIRRAGLGDMDWFTRPLTAFTLTGMAVANIWPYESSAAANASIRCEIARVEGDGTSPTVWASWCIAPLTTDNGELPVSGSLVVRTVYMSGDDLAISNGQRLRIRFYGEDMSSTPMVTGWSANLRYNEPSAGVAGDTYITFPQTLTEYSVSSAPGPSQSHRQRRASRFLTSR